MKNPLSNTDLFKLSALLFVSFAFFYLGKRWSDGNQRILFFSSYTSSRTSQQNGYVSLSPNLNKSFDISFLISQNQSLASPYIVPSPATVDPLPPPPPPERFGIVNEDGTMSDDFEIGEYDPDLVETEWNGDRNGTEATKSFKITRYEMCPGSMREYIPCLDNVEAIKQLKSTDKGERFERHCPLNGTGLNCLVPAPKGYKTPIPWPRSRNEVLNLKIETF